MARLPIFDGLVPLTREQLMRLIEDAFDCRPGEPRAYFELNGAREHYRVLAWACRVKKGEDPERNLAMCRAALWKQLSSIRSQFPEGKPWDRDATPNPALYWRHPDAKVQEESEPDGRHMRYLVRCRVAVPGCNWSWVPSVHVEGELPAMLQPPRSDGGA